MTEALKQNINTSLAQSSNEKNDKYFTVSLQTPLEKCLRKRGNWITSRYNDSDLLFFLNRILKVSY